MTGRRSPRYVNPEGRFRITAPKLIEALSFKGVDEGKQTRPALRLATVLGTQLVDELADSQLFGHVKGAFTGADQASLGIFGDHSVVDVLLDEIGDITPRVQAKLLHFIETRQFRKVGSPASEEQESSHRTLLATNRPLEHLVAVGDFREDLYWRLQSHVITIPPLRERLDVIEELAASILRSVNYRHRGEEERLPTADPTRDRYRVLPADERVPGREEVSNWVLRFDDEDLAWCKTYEWPGNVRKLRHRIEQYVFHDGFRRLRDVLPPQRGLTNAAPPPLATAAELVERAVELEVHAALNGGNSPFGTPNDYLARFRQLVTSAFREVRDRST